MQVLIPLTREGVGFVASNHTSQSVRKVVIVVRVTALRCTPFSIPLRNSVSFSTGRLDAADHVLLEVETDEGITGVAEAIPRSMVYGESQASIVAAIRDWFAPMVIGLNPFEVERLWERVSVVEGNHTCKGALDIAMHDIQGKALGLPCYQLLGAWQNRIRISCLLGFGAAGDVARRAAEAVAERGFTAFKLKVGKDPHRDVETIRSVREAVGSEAIIALDANHGYRGPQAIKVLDLTADCDVSWLEEPCPVEDPDGRRMVAQFARVPVLLDESCRTFGEVYREVQSGSGRMVSIKTPRTGFRLSRKIVDFCEGSGVDNLVGTQGETGLGTLASLHFAVASPRTAAHPAELSWSTTEMADDLLVDTPLVRHGFLEVPDAPGIGAVLDPDKVRHYTVSL